MLQGDVHNSVDLMRCVSEKGFLPLLSMGIRGWSAEEMSDEESCYTVLPDGGWEWKLWEWKGQVIQESGCAYGKFFCGKAAFISREWWPHFCNWRRHLHPEPEEGSIEEAILLTLQEHGSMITRELRAACGFSGPKMRSKFDSYVTRLQMAARIVTEDFIYPLDKHGRQYGWGWALLTTPEAFLGKEACHTSCTPTQSFQLMSQHFKTALHIDSDPAILKLLG